jgi:hypothetical protein
MEVASWPAALWIGDEPPGWDSLANYESVVVLADFERRREDTPL